MRSHAMRGMLARVSGGGGGPYVPVNAEVSTWAAAVGTADGQALEDGVVQAVDTLVTTCKSDTMWSSIKCLGLIGYAPRTLAGALVALKGPNPTNVNFVSGDYNRNTGLKGNASNKYLITNVTFTSDERLNCGCSYYSEEEAAGAGPQPRTIGTRQASNGDVAIHKGLPSQVPWRAANNSFTTPAFVPGLGFNGVARNSTTNMSYANNVSYATSTAGPTTIISTTNIAVFTRWDTGSPDLTNICDARLSMYAVHNYLDLQLLRSRFATMRASILAAI